MVASLTIYSIIQNTKGKKNPKEKDAATDTSPTFMPQGDFQCKNNA